MKGRTSKKTAKTGGLTIAYTRVSTEDQARLGVSLDAQRARIKAWALAMDRTIDEFIVDDGKSAKDLNRPGFRRLQALIDAGAVKCIVCCKIDRLTRSVRDLAALMERFQKADVALVSVTEAFDTGTAAGRMLLHLLGTFAQWERDAIGERTAEALAHKRKQRRPYGHAPFGYRRKGEKLVSVPKEQRALTQLRRLQAEGASLRAMAEYLAAQRIKPRQGGSQWYAQSIKQILGSRMATA